MNPIALNTHELQERADNVVNTYTDVKDCISDLDYLHNSIKDEFSKIYRQAVRMEMKLSVTPSIPQTIISQQYRNMPSKNTKKFCIRVID